MRLEVSTSSPEIQAGVIFSVFAKISNPFETEVRVNRVFCVIPVEFVDIVRFRREYLERQPSGNPNVAGFKFNISVGHGTVEELAATSQVAIAQANHSPSEVASDKDGLSSIILQPGDSGIQHFTLRTRKWLLFQPATYTLPITIDYTIAGKQHRDIVSFRTNIRAPLRAIIWGTTIGAFLGFLLHDLTGDKQIEKIFSTASASGFWGLVGAVGTALFLSLVSILSAILTIVAFARKRDAQPFITVEDFLGGMFVGTVVGYGGQTLVQPLLSGNPGGSHPGGRPGE